MGPYEIHAEEQNGHWIAWLTRDGNPAPYRSALLVGASREEAERRAREWIERQSD